MQLDLAPHRASLYAQKTDHALLCLIGQPDIELSLPGVSVLAISPNDWNADLSPTAAPKVFQTGGDFAGHAEAFLADVLRAVDFAQAQHGSYQKHILVGYSLAGLFALWACTKTVRFTLAGSVSGSLWFDGFIENFTQQDLSHLRGAYLSHGAREHRSKSARLQRIDACTRSAYDHLITCGVPAKYEINPGGHFDDCSGRIIRAVEFLSAI